VISPGDPLRLELMHPLSVVVGRVIPFLSSPFFLTHLTEKKRREIFHASVRERYIRPTLAFPLRFVSRERFTV